MIYTIDVVKEVVQHTEIEGNTLREALQKIVDLDDDVDLQWDDLDDMDVDHEQPSAIIGVSVEGNTDKQDRELLKESKKIWKEIG